MQVMLCRLQTSGAVAQSSSASKPPTRHAQSAQKMAPRELCAVDRRAMLMGAGAAALSMTLAPGNALAVQGITAGRIPGLSTEVLVLLCSSMDSENHKNHHLPNCPQADDNGFYTYVRPEGKSGGHGVGWSEVPRYSFKVPAGWEETPVSIADLGGTEVLQGMLR